MAGSQETARWLSDLRRGESQAAAALWEEYFSKLVHLAHHKLGRMPRRVADEEDVALSAMQSFCQGLQAGQFQLGDRDDLWKLLVKITARKACAQQRRHHAQKRGGGQIRGESVFGRPGDDAGIDQAAGPEPGPETANLVLEQCNRLLGDLDDERLRKIAVRTLEGYSTTEIAKELGCAKRTIERKLERIRAKWSQEAEGA